MHATIYQLSKEPVAEENRITEENLPDWFWGTMDYADTVEDKVGMERAAQTGSRPGLQFDPETRKLTVVSAEEFFKRKFEAFKEEIRKMEGWSLETFINGGNCEMVRLKDAYNDEWGIYVYTEESGLEPLDQYVRYGGKGGYIGAVLDYHY